MRNNVSVNMVNTRSNKEPKAEEKVTKDPIIPVRETDLETPDQSKDGAERKTTESTPMPNVEEQEKKTIEFSTIGNVDETTNNTPETIKKRFSNKKNVVHKEDYSDGRNETKRERGRKTSNRENQNVWHSFRISDRS